MVKERQREGVVPGGGWQWRGKLTQHVINWMGLYKV